MDNNNRSILASIYRNIEYYRDMITLSSSPYQSMFYERQLYNERARLNYWKNYYYNTINNQQNQLNQSIQPSQRNLPEERVFTVEELAQYDGSKGAVATKNSGLYNIVANSEEM